MKKVYKFCALLVVVVSLTAYSHGQTVTSAPEEMPILIGAGDLLTISVYDNPELLQDARVESDGKIDLNLIGSVQVGGLTAQMAGQRIASEFASHHMLVKPQATVVIKEYAARSISVTGEVNHPGVYPVMSQRTVLDMISAAGGLTNLADTRVTVKHRSGTIGTVTVKLKQDEAGEALQEDQVVNPGDVILVPRAGVVYVMGEVQRPGGFVMQDNGRITMLQALAQAGGTIYTASMSNAYLLHKGDTGYKASRINLSDMVKGRSNDVPLDRNDILYVPGSKVKHLTQNTDSVVQAAVGATIFHAF